MITFLYCVFWLYMYFCKGRDGHDWEAIFGIVLCLAEILLYVAMGWV